MTPTRLFYIAFPYFIPFVGFLGGIVFQLIFISLQYLFTSCTTAGDFFKIHLKYARILLGNSIKKRGDGSQLVVHESSFRNASWYIIVSECFVAGTVLFYTLSNFVQVSKQTCSSITNDNYTHCFNTVTVDNTILKCSQYLQEGKESELVCYSIDYDFGIGIAVMGGCIHLFPLLYSHITGFVINNSARYHLPCIIAMLQVAIALLILVSMAAVGVIISRRDGLAQNSKTFVEVLFFFFFLLFTFLTPWCCMDRDQDKAYVFDEDGKITESFQQVGVDDGATANTERSPLNRGHYQSKRHRK